VRWKALEKLEGKYFFYLSSIYNRSKVIDVQSLNKDDVITRSVLKKYIYPVIVSDSQATTGTLPV